MKTTDAFIILITLIIIYMIVKSSSTREKFVEDNSFKAQKNKKNIVVPTDVPKTFNNDIFIESQFHTDYRDVLTAFHDMTTMKQIFNMENVPLKFTRPPIEEVTQIASDFVDQLNNVINKDIADYRTKNTGWDEFIENKPIESGWEKQMRRLGLPTNVYDDTAKKSKVVLLSVNNVEKYETASEIKYNIFLFIKKTNVEDRIAIKLTVVLTKDNMPVTSKTHLVIEEIYMLGYMTDTGDNKINDIGLDNFYNFKDLEKQNIYSRKQVIDELIKNRAIRNNQNSDFSAAVTSFNASLDNFNGPIGEEYRKGLKPTYKTKSYNVSKTIYNDDFPSH